MRYWFVLLLLPAPTLAQSGYDQCVSRGQEALQKKAYPAAITWLGNALAQDSTRPEAYLLLTSAYLLQSQPNAAAPVAQRGTRRFPQLLAMQWLLAETRLQQNQPDEALALYERLETAAQTNLTSNHAEANAGLPTAQLRNRLGMLYGNRGTVALQQDRPAEAVDFFTKAQRYLPPSRELWVSRAYAHLQAGDAATARRVASEGLRQFPKEDKLQRLLAAASGRQPQDLKSVIASYQRQYAQQPRDAPVALAYAEALLTDQQTAAGNRVLDQLLDENAANRQTYEDVLRVYGNRQDWAGKLRTLRRLQNQFPDDQAVWQRVALACEARQLWPQARQLYDSLARFADKPLEHRLALAHTWERQDSLARAARVYAQLARDFPNEIPVLVRWGNALATTQQWADASDVYQRWVNLAPTQAPPLVRLGWAFEKQGDPTRALPHYQKALSLATREAVPYLRQSQHLLTTQPEEAYALAEQALRKGLSFSQKEQEVLLGQLKGSQDLLAAQVDRGQANGLADNEQVTEEAFIYFTRQFPAARTAPVLDSLLKQYQGSGRLYGWVGEFYQQQGNEARALALWEQAVGWQPSLRPVQVALANYHERHQQPDRAILAFERALSLDPRASDAYQALIRLYRQRGKLPDLCQRWLARHRTDPTNATLKTHLVEALHKAGDYPTAQQVLDGN